ncbi:glycosyltransferase [Mycolicibacterium chubuense NBB4]|uniref:Glycosyltransferase n=2 Tax=Mycolicibacterium chubuense TaxID=1800 RepID=I4BFP6_MYCCN|nr:glycosyltransferase [Mycolicibacterium chubuense NBB4]
MLPGSLYFRKRMYDFDESALNSIDAREISLFRAAWILATKRLEFIELNEPAMLPAWPSLIVYVSIIRMKRAVIRVVTAGRGKQTPPLVVAYAIENNPLIPAFCDFTKLPLFLSHAIALGVFRYVAGCFDRIAFGTRDAQVNYQQLFSSAHRRGGAETAHFSPLINACSCGTLSKQRSALFVGEFSERKGIASMLELWDKVRKLSSGSSFVIVGKGELESTVRDWASNKSEVTVLVDPPRSVIHRELRRASLLILLSQSTARWREQIGLPLTEGLSHGCEILTTEKVGFAHWLRAHGHLVVPEKFDRMTVARAVTQRLREPRNPTHIIKVLPPENGRITADRWLHRPPEPGCPDIPTPRERARTITRDADMPRRKT